MNREEGCTIIHCRTLCEQDHQVLSLLYGPLMGHEALALYETMLALGADEHLPHDHTPFILLGFSVDRVHQQRQILERCARTWIQRISLMSISSARLWKAMRFCAMRCWAGCI